MRKTKAHNIKSINVVQKESVDTSNLPRLDFKPLQPMKYPPKREGSLDYLKIPSLFSNERIEYHVGTL